MKERQAYSVRFAARARYYRALDRELAVATSFFAAAASVNELLHRLYRLGILQGTALSVLEGLGAHLLQSNGELAGYLRGRRPSLRPLLLSRCLIQWEQRLAQRHLQSLRAKDEQAYLAACGLIDRLLVHPLLGAPLLTRIARLDVFTRVARQAPPRFDDRNYRVAIGHARIDKLKIQSDPGAARYRPR